MGLSVALTQQTEENRKGRSKKYRIVTTLKSREVNSCM